MYTLLLAFFLLVFSFSSNPFDLNQKGNEHIVAQKTMSLNTRHTNQFVNDVFRDNILLNISYISNAVSSPQNIDWSDIRKPSTYELVLNPGEKFAYHDNVLPEYAGKISKTTNAHFNAEDGFRNSGYLYGDGVCHLASLLYWTAKDAGLEAISPVSHDFAVIPEVPREHGVSIYFMPGESYSSKVQNLYITNTKNVAVTFRFVYENDNLTINVVEKNKTS